MTTRRLLTRCLAGVAPLLAACADAPTSPVSVATSDAGTADVRAGVPIAGGAALLITDARQRVVPAIRDEGVQGELDAALKTLAKALEAGRTDDALHALDRVGHALDKSARDPLGTAPADADAVRLAVTHLRRTLEPSRTGGR